MGVQAYEAIKDYLAGEDIPKLILVPSACSSRTRRLRNYAARSAA